MLLSLPKKNGHTFPDCMSIFLSKREYSKENTSKNSNDLKIKRVYFIPPHKEHRMLYF
ncbi:Uncharacterised protein [Myroides odoratus]|uniref:Uncharacterized protein n=1 Tax=Myroides odoratus TaxID=256 RepID=A0A378RNI9_MYROD|nr:Uncharacterised protein [Myroides odoratus]